MMPRPPITNFAASMKLRARAKAAIPGGAHTYAKGDDQYPELSPSHFVRGRGCRVWDADGNEYIEYGMGNRAVTLGHAYEPVVKAVRALYPDEETGLTDREVAYMGDDWLDLVILERVGLAAAPADAMKEVRQRVHWVSRFPGGRGAVRELVELTLRAHGRWNEVLGRPAG